jgi:hypothetical protein
MSSTTSSAVSSMPNSMSSMASSISSRVSSTVSSMSNTLSSLVSSIVLLPWNLKLVRLGGDTQISPPKVCNHSSFIESPTFCLLLLPRMSGDPYMENCTWASVRQKPNPGWLILL